MEGKVKHFLWGMLLWAVTLTGTRAQPTQDFSFPFVQNYSKLLYQSGNQNWSIAEGRNRVKYFGNSKGLLAFDGNYWQLYKMPNKVIVRAVAADERGDKVYAGGFGEFGYWKYNDKGRFVYTSFIDLIPKEHALKDEIWKIYVDQSRVIFQSFSAIYIYEKGKIQVVKGEQSFLFLLKAGNRYFVEVLGKGLYELKNNKLAFIQGSAFLGDAHVLSVLPYQGNSFLIGTVKNGLFLYDQGGIKPWANGANEFLKANQLNNGVLLKDSAIAYGTILNGVVILDKHGNILHKVNKASGLQNNTVLSLFADQEQNLWAGLDNGVDRVEVDSPFYFYFDKTGKFGTVYSSLIHDGKIYLGTNQGLFYSEWPAQRNQSYQSLDFKIIEGSQGQVWELALMGGQLLCGHNEGTFQVVGNQLRKLSDFKGGWTLKKLASQEKMLIQGTYTGLVVYKKDQMTGNWVLSHKIEGFGEPSRYVEQDNNGQIWVSHAYKGLYKLTLSPDLKKVEALQYYNQKQGLPADYRINTFQLNGRIVFTSDAGFYIYDAISDTFSSYTELNKKLGAFASSNRIIKAAGTQYWFINHGKVALVDMPKAGTVTVSANPFTMLSGHMLEYYENISRISNSIYLISIDEGFVVYNADLRFTRKKAMPKVLIRKVQHSAEDNALLTEVATHWLKIPYKRNSLSISFSLPYFSQMKPRFQYYLEGYSQDWSDWAYTTQKEFINLAQGDYRFLVRAKVEGGAVSPITVFRFTVGPPWFATYWAMLGYLLLGSGLVYLSKYFYQVKLRKDKARIEMRLEQEKEEVLRRESLINEQKLVRLRNEQLQSELATKSRELANSALSIVSKNELLSGIREEILQLKDASGKKLAPEQLKKLQRVIEDGMDTDYDWNLFESSFNEAHENYFKKLKTQHAELTPKDLKLCAYLRLNMNSKEIATLLNITVRSVEISRYRLRKKLNLYHEKNLVEFLMEV